jgi:uncharacterized membrane protein YedE/YeeE
MTDVLEALVLGALFGFALQKAGLTRYARIVGVFRLRDMSVMQFMLTALVVAATLNQAFAALGLAHAPPTPPTFVVSNVLGGVVFGVGMATAGYCPGTIVAQAGEGHLDAWIGGFSGLIVGAVAFGLVQPWLVPKLAHLWALGRTTFSAMVGGSAWLSLLVFVELVALVLHLVSRGPSAPRSSHGSGGQAHA